MSITSSSFRPQVCVAPVYLSNKTDCNHSRLEQLPFVILELIFDHLGKNDFLNISLVSKELYVPAVKCLFLKISITDDFLGAAYAEDQIRRFATYNCTIIKSSKVKMLLRVIEKSHFLASLIHSINVVNAMDITLIPHLLVHTRLKSFHHREHFEMPPKATAKMESMTCPISITFTYAPNLVELKLIYSIRNKNFENFEKLALRMVELNRFHNLKKLIFEGAGRSKPNEFVEDENEILPQASWAVFFKVFARKKAMLNIVALGLDGNIGNKGKEIAGLISEVVPLCNLVSLELSYFENCHSRERHSDQEITFLEAITLHLPLLRYLVIKPTGNCEICQLNSIARVLKDNIPNQLKHLAISFTPPKDFDSEKIRSIILVYQRNILQLKFEDTSTSWYQLKLVLKNLDFSQFLKWSKYSYDGSKIFPTRILDYGMTRPYHHQAKINLIRLCKTHIKSFLNSDLIYINAPKKLPFMKEYCVLDFHIDMKSLGIITNQSTIPFET